jgi:hypothetical protein
VPDSPQPILKSRSVRAGIVLLAFQLRDFFVGERGVSSKSCGRFAAVFATPLGNLVVVIVAAALIFWGVWRAQRAGTQPRGSSQGVEAVSEQSEAKQELQGLRDRNEQLEQLNANLQAERGQLSELLQDTKCENRKLKEEHQAGQKEIQRLHGLYREALEDEQGVVHWGQANAVDIGALAANAEAKRKNEELRAENERLRNQVASPEVSRQKRLCFHLADDLRGLSVLC